MSGQNTLFSNPAKIIPLLRKTPTPPPRTTVAEKPHKHLRNPVDSDGEVLAFGAVS
jgi:hypothetical protein